MPDMQRRVFAPVPADLTEALVAFQYDSVARQIPALHLVALVNLGLITAVLWYQNAPVEAWAWVPLVALFNVIRIAQWLGRAQSHAHPRDARRFLRSASIAAVGSVGSIGAYSAWSVTTGLFVDPVLIPVSLAFGAFSVAHCFAALRATASLVLVLGVLPSAVMMVLGGDFLSVCLAISASSVVLLQLRFLADHERHIIATLRARRDIEMLAQRDALTGLPNRRAFLDRWPHEVAAAHRAGQRASLLVIDIDRFKAINDGHGHEIGDRVLMGFAALLSETSRESDLVARFGGEEFVVLAVTRDPGDAAALAERLRDTIALHDFAGVDCPVSRVTVSIGLDTITPGESFAAVFARADAALYAAKLAGRNRVATAVERVESIAA